MNDLARKLNSVLESSEKKLKTVTEQQSSKKSSPDKWSSKEILGHLIDSSFNNMIRFVNGQFKSDLEFSGYDQNKWVEAQHYQNAEWNFLIGLWTMNNLQLVRVIGSIPDDVLKKSTINHNYDLIAWKELSKNESATLEYLIEDYIGHMKHHLNQIFILLEK
ncbi:MAG: DinB family protein [Ignavibacteriales bacterium]|nr:MAG: DinB family protein [Ignavibacteriales bacterium]